VFIFGEAACSIGRFTPTHQGRLTRILIAGDNCIICCLSFILLRHSSVLSVLSCLVLSCLVFLFFLFLFLFLFLFFLHEAHSSPPSSTTRQQHLLVLGLVSSCSIIVDVAKTRRKKERKLFLPFLLFTSPTQGLQPCTWLTSFLNRPEPFSRPIWSLEQRQRSTVFSEMKLQVKNPNHTF